MKMKPDKEGMISVYIFQAERWGCCCSVAKSLPDSVFPHMDTPQTSKLLSFTKFPELKSLESVMSSASHFLCCPLLLLGQSLIDILEKEMANHSNIANSTIP